SGRAHFFLDGAPAGETTFAPGALDGSSHALTIGGPGGARAACPNGDGNVPATIEEVRLSRVDRFAPEAPPLDDAGSPDDEAGSPDDDAGSAFEDAGEG